MTPYPKAVLFDWDNTLADTLPFALQVMNETLAYFNHPLWTMEKFIETPHLSLKDSFTSLFQENAEKAGEFYNGLVEKNHLKSLKVLAHSKELLSYLKENNVYTAVVSNKIGKFLRLEIEMLGWNSYFTSVIGSLDCDHDKPSAVPVLEALKKIACSPGQDIWFVGDSSVDIRCARNAGCVPVFVGTYLDTVHHGDDIIWAENCLGLLSILKKYNKSSH